MSKKREVFKSDLELDVELQAYLREVERRDPVIITPRVSGEIESVAAKTYEHVISSISSAKIPETLPDENSGKELALILDMTLEFENKYGEDAARLLVSVRNYYEQDNKLNSNALSLIITLLKEFFDKFSIKFRPEVVRIVLTLKPHNYTVLEFSQLLNDVVDWVRLTKPILIHTFIEQEIIFLERKSISEEVGGVRMEDRQYLIDLIGKLKDIYRLYGYAVVNKYLEIYLNEDEVQANRYLREVIE